MKIYRAPEERAVRIIFDSDEEYNQKAFKVNVDSNEDPAESEHFAEMEDVFEDGLRKMGYLDD